MTSAAGRAASKGPSTPLAAPPAPSNRMCRPASGSFRFWVRSAIRPAPSVFSPSNVPLSCTIVFTASASSARGLNSLTRSAAARLCGSVTLAPAAVPGEELEHVVPEFFRRRFVQAVRHLLSRLPREQALYERRPAVMHRVAEQAVGCRDRITACLQGGRPAATCSVRNHWKHAWRSTSGCRPRPRA